MSVVKGRLPQVLEWLEDTPFRPGRILGVSMGVVAWYALATISPANVMPYPSHVLSLTWELVVDGVIWRHLWATIYRTLWGFLGTMVLGGAMGVIMGVNSFGQRLLVPQVLIGFSIPTIAWAAISTLIFGFSDFAPIFATVIVVFPIIAVNVWKGVEEVEGDLIRMSKSFDISRRRLLFRMILPSTAPALFAASRLGLATAWKIVTIAEMFAASKGVGYKIIQSYEFVQFDKAWAWAVAFMIVILFIEYVIFKPLERKVFEYRQDADISIVG